MAVTVTIVRQGSGVAIFEVESDADADVAAVIPHGLGFPVEDIELTALQAEFYTSIPILGLVDNVNINLVLANAVGSGVADPQIRVIARIPEQVIR